MKCFGNLDAQPFRITTETGGHVLDVPRGAFALVNSTEVNGKTVLSLPSGESISVAPTGAVQTRQAGTAGPWETGVVDSGIIAYTPDPLSGVAFVFGLREA